MVTLLEVASITLLSFVVSGTAVVIASPIGILLGALVGMREFAGKRPVVYTVNTLMGIPPVFVGLILYLSFSNIGPLGSLGLLFTPAAMVVAQVVIATPLVTGVTIAAVANVQKAVRDTVVSLGATGEQLLWTVIKEAKMGLITAVIVAFGRVASEVGAIIIVGGDIRGFTRTLTTGLVGLVRIGDFQLAIVLGIVLIVMSFTVNTVLTHLQLRGTMYR